MIGADGAIAFEGAGAAAGDVIDLSAINANTGVRGNRAFAFGSVATGGPQVVGEGTDSAGLANIDADADFEVRPVIEDGGVLASDHTAADFTLFGHLTPVLSRGPELVVAVRVDVAPIVARTVPL